MVLDIIYLKDYKTLSLNVYSRRETWMCVKGVCLWADERLLPEWNGITRRNTFRNTHRRISEKHPDEARLCQPWESAPHTESTVNIIIPDLHISDRSQKWSSPARRTDARTDTRKIKTSPSISELNSPVVLTVFRCCFISTVLVLV